MSPSVGILMLELTRFILGLAEKLISREIGPENAKVQLSEEFDRVASILAEKDSEVG